MGTSNGTYASFDDRLDTLSKNFGQVIAHMTAMREHADEVKTTEVSGARATFAKAGKIIKSHPIAAVGIAFAVGYGVMRMLRR